MRRRSFLGSIVGGIGAVVGAKLMPELAPAPVSPALASISVLAGSTGRARIYFGDAT